MPREGVAAGERSGRRECSKKGEVMSDSTARAARRIVASMQSGFTAVHTRVPVDLSEFEHLDLTAYDAYQEDMEAHGFRHMADYEILELRNKPNAALVRTFIRAMLSRDGKVQSSYYQARPLLRTELNLLFMGLLNFRFISAPAKFRQKMKTRHCVDFETEFDDGHFIVTSNAEGAGRLASPPEIDNLFFPYGTPVDELMDEHYRRLVAAIKKSSVKPLVVTNLDELYRSANRATAIKSAFRHSGGPVISRDELRRLSSGNTEVADAVYAEIIKQRSDDGAAAPAAGTGAVRPGTRPGSAAAEAHAASPQEEFDDEELDDEEEGEGQEAGGGKRGCLFAPLMILGLLLVMVLPRRAGSWLISSGLRFMLPREVRARMDAAEKEMEEAEARPMPRRVAMQTAGAGGAAPARPAAAAAEGSVGFAYDPERGELVAAVELSAWSGYACENSNPEFPGARVLLRLRGVADAECHDALSVHHGAVRWLRAHDQGLHDAILAALARHTPALAARLDEYGDEESLRLLRSPGGWKKLIDLSYIDVFPYTRDGMPYLAFEFECNWDPEHGFKLLINGPRVVDIDAGDYGSEDVLADGGKPA